MGGGLAIYGDPADEQTGEDVMGVIVGEDDHATTGRRNGNVINSRYSHLPAIGQMNGEGDKRYRVNQLSNVSSHKIWRRLLGCWTKGKGGAERT